MVASSPSLTLTEFLQQPETQPASEFWGGNIVQKPMPQGEHSRLQYKLCAEINQAGEPGQIAMAFPELRCTFAGNALVPDISVFRWSRIPRQPSGRIANRFETYPDWVIEILSPDQSQTQVLEKLLFCISAGSELGWLIDPDQESLLVVLPGQQVQILRHQASLPVLSGVELPLTVLELFGWLTV
jgi:Uma2 family endonuclease